MRGSRSALLLYSALAFENFLGSHSQVWSITLLLPERVLPTLTAKIGIIPETTKVFVRKFEYNAFTTSIRSQSPMPANSEYEAYGPKAMTYLADASRCERKIHSFHSSFLIPHFENSTHPTHPTGLKDRCTKE